MPFPKDPFPDALHPAKMTLSYRFFAWHFVKEQGKGVPYTRTIFRFDYHWAGGGAYPAAFRLARSGMNVLMVDSKGVMSGNCLAEGCVPSKAVREVAQQMERRRRFVSFGLCGKLEMDFS